MLRRPCGHRRSMGGEPWAKRVTVWFRVQRLPATAPPTWRPPEAAVVIPAPVYPRHVIGAPLRGGGTPRRDHGPGRAGPGRAGGSRPRRAVDAFAQQVGVAVVPGVLLDHVR